MAVYKIQFKKSVAKDLRNLPAIDLTRILAAIDSLADNPRPPGAEKLSGRELWRIRQGNYRILYEIHDGILTVIVIKVGHRREEGG